MNSSGVFLRNLVCLTAMLLTVGCGGEENASEGGNEDAGVHDVAGDTAGDAGEADATPQADTDSDADTSEGCEEDGADADADGLTDCEEERIGTDPDNPDTDGDGLSDTRELQQGTDPRNADTDGDGLDDSREADLGLDPLSADSFGDGTLDSERWFVDLCEVEEAADVAIHTNDGPADWSVALAASFDNYTELSIDGADAQNRHAAAVYSDSQIEVAGAILSATDASADVSPSAKQQEYVQAIEAVAATEHSAVGGEFTTHDFQLAAIGRYRVSVASATSAEQLRDELLIALAPFEEADVSGLPTADGAAASEFRVVLTAIVRTSDDGDDQVLTLLAVTPESQYAAEGAAMFALDDLTNTNQLAQASAAVISDCDVYQRARPVQMDFYWVVDHTDSMSAHAAKVTDAADEFFSLTEEAGVDARFGVTSMEQNNKGRLDLTLGWQRDRQAFVDEVEDVVNRGGDKPYGLYAAREGISFMRSITGSPNDQERVRQYAHLVTFFVTDSEAQSFVDEPLDGSGGQQLLQSFENFFASYTFAAGLLGDGQDCGIAAGESYELIIEDTGGDTASLCADGWRALFEQIVYGVRTVHPFALPDVPIPSSIRVFANGDEIPRGRTNGFDYFPKTNTLGFFGDARSQPAGEDPPPDMVVVVYETFGE